MPPNHSRGRGLVWNSTEPVRVAAVPTLPVCSCCPVHGDELNAKLSHAITRLGEAIEALAKVTPQRPYQELIVLGSGGYIVKNYGRRHIRIWVSTAVTINVSDLLTPVQLSPGWNPLDVPELSVITTAAGPVNARYEATDYDIA